MTTPFRYRRAIRFEEVDRAGIVFFARFFALCHEAMESFFGGLEGGYPHFIGGRGLGVPAVRAEAEYNAPLRYGDTVDIDVDVVQLGTSSTTLRYRMTRGNQAIAVIRHKVVCCQLAGPTPVPWPDDVRRLLTVHLSPG